MPRLPFIHFPGACYHITTRGNNRDQTFFEANDYLRYLKRLSQTKEAVKFKLFAYCLMPNHAHLLIEVNKTPISKIMQSIQTGYTMYFNKKYHHTGHVFHGRYHYFLVDKDNYLLSLIQYIHLNPIRANLVKNPGDYVWSSYLDIVNQNKSSFVDIEEILNLFTEVKESGVVGFKKFIQSWLPEKEDIFGNIKREIILGDSQFVKKVEGYFKQVKNRI